MPENWISLPGVILARNFDEFCRAYKLSHKTIATNDKGGPLSLWKVITIKHTDPSYIYKKKWLEKKKREKKDGLYEKN